MNIGISENRAICKFNLRGMCRFGTRCWNLHEIPEKTTQKDIEKYEPNEEDGACALPIIEHKEPASTIYGPGTSTTETAINLVKKLSESEEKVCGICFDVVLKKVRNQQTFGILPNCNHCFCFACIRKWRQSKEFEFEVSKSCPECRIQSEFVYPSRIWLETQEEKTNFIDGQRRRMKQQDCKYFRQGKGKCPFGNTCLYLHALPDGTVLDVGPPKRKRRGMQSMTMAEFRDALGYALFGSDDYGDASSDFDLDFLDDFPMPDHWLRPDANNEPDAGVHGFYKPFDYRPVAEKLMHDLQMLRDVSGDFSDDSDSEDEACYLY